MIIFLLVYTLVGIVLTSLIAYDEYQSGCPALRQLSKFPIQLFFVIFIPMVFVIPVTHVINSIIQFFKNKN